MGPQRESRRTSRPRFAMTGRNRPDILGKAVLERHARKEGPRGAHAACERRAPEGRQSSTPATQAPPRSYRTLLTSSAVPAAQPCRVGQTGMAHEAVTAPLCRTFEPRGAFPSYPADQLRMVAVISRNCRPTSSRRRAQRAFWERRLSPRLRCPRPRDPRVEPRLRCALPGGTAVVSGKVVPPRRLMAGRFRLWTPRRKDTRVRHPKPCVNWPIAGQRPGRPPLSPA